jgi:MFS family permease
VRQLLGGYLSDSYLGKYRTILYFVMVYLVGTAVLALSALGLSVAGTLVGLALIALGTGGIKPCVSAFGGDQVRAVVCACFVVSHAPHVFGCPQCSPVYKLPVDCPLPPPSW